MRSEKRTKKPARLIDYLTENGAPALCRREEARQPALTCGIPLEKLLEERLHPRE